MRLLSCNLVLHLLTEVVNTAWKNISNQTISPYAISMLWIEINTIWKYLSLFTKKNALGNHEGGAFSST